MNRLHAFVLFCLAVWPGVASAHVTELAVLRLTELGSGRYTVGWEMKPTTDAGVGLEPIFPRHCTYEDRQLDCGDEGLVGALGFQQIGDGQSAAMFKVRTLDGTTQIYTLTPAAPTVRVSREFCADGWACLLEVGGAYVMIGIEHILLGVDHLLFVLGLMWISRGAWMLFKTITAFTLAHSVTLVAVTFGWVGVPESFVNALIALSIVFIGVEALHAREGRSTFAIRNPWVVAFLFGLLHGFGFANALVELGLPDQALPIALLGFNIGVELGQIAFVFGVLSLNAAYRVMRVNWPSWSYVVPMYLVGTAGAFWFFQRFEIILEG